MAKPSVRKGDCKNVIFTLQEFTSITLLAVISFQKVLVIYMLAGS